MFERMQTRIKRDKQRETTSTGRLSRNERARKKSTVTSEREGTEEEEAAVERTKQLQEMAKARAARSQARHAALAALESNSTSAVESSEEPPNPFTSTPVNDPELNARLNSRFASASTSRSVVAVAASTSTGPVTSNVDSSAVVDEGEEEGEVVEGTAEEVEVNAVTALEPNNAAAVAAVAPMSHGNDQNDNEGTEQNEEEVVGAELAVATAAPNPVAPPVVIEAVVDENVADVDVDESGIPVLQDRILRHHLDRFVKEKNNPNLEGQQAEFTLLRYNERADTYDLFQRLGPRQGNGKWINVKERSEIWGAFTDYGRDAREVAEQNPGKKIKLRVGASRPQTSKRKLNEILGAMSENRRRKRANDDAFAAMRRAREAREDYRQKTVRATQCLSIALRHLGLAEEGCKVDSLSNLQKYVVGPQRPCKWGWPELTEHNLYLPTLEVFIARAKSFEKYVLQVRFFVFCIIHFHFSRFSSKTRVPAVTLWLSPTAKYSTTKKSFH